MRLYYYTGLLKGGTQLAEVQSSQTAQILRPTASPADLAVNYSRDLLRSIGRFVLKRVHRTRSVVDLEYNSGHWQRVLSEKLWLNTKSVETFLVGNDGPTAISRVDGRIVRISARDYRRYRIDALDTLLRRLSSDADSLVEIGSGFGYNLFSLSCTGHWRSLKGYDIAPNGIEAGRQIAAHFGLSDRITFDRMDVTNTKDANLAHLKGQTVFTFFCIEQLPYAVAEVVDNLLRAGPRRVINIEPATDMLDLRRPRDFVSFAYLKSADYQTRLFGLLDRLEVEGRLKVVARERMQFAPTFHNDGLLYCWEPTST